MKKSYFFVVALICLAGICRGQIEIGPKLGLNFSNQSHPYVHSYSIDPGYSHGEPITRAGIGCLADFTLSRTWCLRAQLNLAAIGYKLPEDHDPSGNLTSPRHEFHLTYLGIPLHLLYKIVSKGGTIWVGAGPFVAFLIDGKYKLGSGAEQPIIIGPNDKAQFRPGDAGVSGAVGFKFHNGFLVGLDYYRGLVDASYVAASSRNNYASLYLGYVFARKGH